MGYGFYLYGIFPAPGPKNLDLKGLDRQPVQAHLLDGFVFLYSEAQQERYLASRRNLLDHEKVLEQAMHAGYRTLLPIPFNRIVEDWQMVTEQVTTPHSHDLEQLFLKLDGHREVGVKLFWDENVERNLMMEENQALKQERDRLEGIALSMDQMIKIGRLIEEGLKDRQQQIIEVFQETLNPLAVEVKENDPMTETMIYNAVYLIPWDLEPTFGENVEALDQQFESRLRIRYNNFTAPYNFAQLE